MSGAEVSTTNAGPLGGTIPRTFDAGKVLVPAPGLTPDHSAGWSFYPLF